jgi:hypothetical protein
MLESEYVKLVIFAEIGPLAIGGCHLAHAQAYTVSVPLGWPDQVYWPKDGGPSSLTGSNYLAPRPNYMTTLYGLIVPRVHIPSGPRPKGTPGVITFVIDAGAISPTGV